VSQSETIQNLKEFFTDPTHPEGSLSAQIRWFIENEVDDGQTFTNQDIHKHSHTFTLQDVDEKQRRITNVSTILSRLKEQGLIERVRGGRQGVWRKKRLQARVVEWWNATGTPLDIWLPLDIMEQARVYPKNILLASGGYNAGKSAFCLKSAIMNMNNFKIDYLVSEMGVEEFALRLSLCGLSEAELTRFKNQVAVFECSHAFEDLVQEDGFTIIDYLSAPSGEAYRVKDTLEAINDKLTTGICIASLHKNYGSDYSYGGQRVYDAPRIVVTLENGAAKLVKAKNWASESNPNGKIIYYKLVNGHEFIPQGVWHHPEDEQSAGFKPKRGFIK